METFFEGPLKRMQRGIWASQVDGQMFEGQKTEADRRFLQFVGQQVFTEIPDDLKRTREQMLEFAQNAFASKTESHARGSMTFIGATHTPGSSSPREIVDAIGVWSTRTAEVLKDSVYPDSNPTFKPVTIGILAEAVEHYVLNQVQEVNRMNSMYGRCFFMMLPDMMALGSDSHLMREYSHTLAHMQLFKGAVAHHMSNVERLRPSFEAMPFLEALSPVSISPNTMMRVSDNLVALVREKDFSLLITTISNDHYFESDGDKAGFAIGLVKNLMQVDDPTMRREILGEAVRRLRAGERERLLENVGEKCLYDLTTYRILVPDPSGNFMKAGLNLNYPGVRQLDEDRRKILRDVVAECRGCKPHNDLMVPHLIQILTTHANPPKDLSRLAWDYSSYIFRTRDDYPTALEGLESESLAVKQKFLNLLTSMCAIKGVVLVREAEEVKSRIQGEKEEARKLALIKEEDQKLRKGVDEMLK